jgi:AcrR family transcriptional regulator
MCAALILREWKSRLKSHQCFVCRGIVTLVRQPAEGVIMAAGTGVRERKKQQTRERIRKAAVRLFQRSSYDDVTVAAIARAANVSQGTVFNYFPTKESLVFSGMESLGVRLLDAIRDRRPGESVIAAFAEFFSGPFPALAADSSESVRAGARIISESAALRAREREIIETYTQSLADLIAEETGAAPDDIEPWAVANALMGVHRGMLNRSRHGVLNGITGDELASDVAAQAKRAFERLQRGLACYGTREPG